MAACSRRKGNQEMPVPNAIAHSPLSYALVWTGPVNVQVRPTPGVLPVPVKARTFHTYIEVLEQGAHDPEIRSLAIARGMQPRPMHRGRVAPLNTGANALTYYQTHGQVVAGLVATYMTQRWTNNPNPAVTVFQPNTAYLPSVQAVIQPNGFSYEITMWYDTADIYAAFHCYHR